jgi:hypothetical protein
MVQQPIHHGDGDGVLGQEPAPLVERPVAGGAEAASFVSGGDEAEQQLGAAGVQGREPDFIDDDQLVAQEPVDHTADGVVGQSLV